MKQGNQELLVVRDKVERPPGELAVSKSVECDIFPSVFWHCWLSDRKVIRPEKKLGVGLLVVMISLELCTTYSSSSTDIHHPLLQLTSANSSSPGKWPLKRRERRWRMYALRAGSGFVRIGPLCFLAGCRKRQLNLCLTS